MTVVVTPKRHRARLAGTRRRMRGAAAVIALLASAAEVLMSALTGLPRPSTAARRFSAVVRDAWRRGARRPLPPPSIVTVTTVEEEDHR